MYKKYLESALKSALNIFYIFFVDITHFVAKYRLAQQWVENLTREKTLLNIIYCIIILRDLISRCFSVALNYVVDPQLAWPSNEDLSWNQTRDICVFNALCYHHVGKASGFRVNLISCYCFELGTHEWHRWCKGIVEDCFEYVL